MSIPFYFSGYPTADLGRKLKDIARFTCSYFLSVMHCPVRTLWNHYCSFFLIIMAGLILMNLTIHSYHRHRGWTLFWTASLGVKGEVCPSPIWKIFEYLRFLKCNLVQHIGQILRKLTLNFWCFCLWRGRKHTSAPHFWLGHPPPTCFLHLWLILKNIAFYLLIWTHECNTTITCPPVSILSTLNVVN